MIRVLNAIEIGALLWLIHGALPLAYQDISDTLPNVSNGNIKHISEIKVPQPGDAHETLRFKEHIHEKAGTIHNKRKNKEDGTKDSSIGKYKKVGATDNNNRKLENEGITDNNNGKYKKVGAANNNNRKHENDGIIDNNNGKYMKIGATDNYNRKHKNDGIIDNNNGKYKKIGAPDNNRKHENDGIIDNNNGKYNKIGSTDNNDRKHENDGIIDNSNGKYKKVSATDNNNIKHENDGMIDNNNGKHKKASITDNNNGKYKTASTTDNNEKKQENKGTIDNNNGKHQKAGTTENNNAKHKTASTTDKNGRKYEKDGTTNNGNRKQEGTGTTDNNPKYQEDHTKDIRNQKFEKGDSADYNRNHGKIGPVGTNNEKSEKAGDIDNPKRKHRMAGTIDNKEQSTQNVNTIKEIDKNNLNTGFSDHGKVIDTIDEIAKTFPSFNKDDKNKESAKGPIKEQRASTKEKIQTTKTTKALPRNTKSTWANRRYSYLLEHSFLDDIYNQERFRRSHPPMKPVLKEHYMKGSYDEELFKMFEDHARSSHGRNAHGSDSYSYSTYEYSGSYSSSEEDDFEWIPNYLLAKPDWNELEYEKYRDSSSIVEYNSDYTHDSYQPESIDEAFDKFVKYIRVSENDKLDGLIKQMPQVENIYTNFIPTQDQFSQVPSPTANSVFPEKNLQEHLKNTIVNIENRETSYSNKNLDNYKEIGKVHQFHQYLMPTTKSDYMAEDFRQHSNYRLPNHFDKLKPYPVINAGKHENIAKSNFAQVQHREKINFPNEELRQQQQKLSYANENVMHDRDENTFKRSRNNILYQTVEHPKVNTDLKLNFLSLGKTPVPIYDDLKIKQYPKPYELNSELKEFGLMPEHKGIVRSAKFETFTETNEYDKLSKSINPNDNLHNFNKGQIPIVGNRKLPSKIPLEQFMYPTNTNFPKESQNIKLHHSRSQISRPPVKKEFKKKSSYSVLEGVASHNTFQDAQLPKDALQHGILELKQKSDLRNEMIANKKNINQDPVVRNQIADDNFYGYNLKPVKKYDTILEYLFNASNNTFIQALKENSKHKPLAA